jgi:sugar/nucleoside kinase (ribokinase family)
MTDPALDISTSVDRMMPDHKMRCAAARHDPGGGGINVARVVRRLGGDVTAVYPCGGLTGQLLARLIERERIASLTSGIAEETRQDFAVHEDASGRQFRNPNGAPASMRSPPARATPVSSSRAAAWRRGCRRISMRVRAGSSNPVPASFCSTHRALR